MSAMTTRGSCGRENTGITITVKTPSRLNTEPAPSDLRPQPNIDNFIFIVEISNNHETFLFQNQNLYIREAIKIEKKKKCNNYYTLGLTPPPRV